MDGHQSHPMPYYRPLQRPPQAVVDEFWAKFTTHTPGKATTVLPQNKPLVDRVVRKNHSLSLSTSSSSSSLSSSPSWSRSAATTSAKTTRESYEEAAVVCRAKVAQIVNECRRINKKYRDTHFDLETDLKLNRRDCLQSLTCIKGDVAPPGYNLNPRSAKRVTEIFDNPRFYIGDPSAKDVRQGRDGDCWLMSALCTLSNKPGLIERLCVAHDQDVGVYGFVFYRDGEWISEIVDDFLYLIKSDYDECRKDRILFDELQRADPEEAYRRVFQANSGALYFAQCKHQQVTWLPLLEKCFAKAHGDYAAIEGGFGGEGIEDLTGGVTSEICTTDILDKELFWNDLLKVNQDFLFGCSTGVWGLSSRGTREGVMDLHCYSIQRAVEIDGKRLVRLKNPWGKDVWKGAWSDGSKEWTAEWLEKLGHRFGDDGDFWISYDDLLRKYQAFERTRLFDSDWSVAQLWTTLAVPWMLSYHETYFSLSISEPGPVVIVLSQLDERYFRGLQGHYRFQLAFRIHKKGKVDYLVRSQVSYRLHRSVNVELELEAGDYDVRVRLDARRSDKIMPTEQVIRNSAKTHREKLIRIGLAYDLAHGKGKVIETAEEQASREAFFGRVEWGRRQEILRMIEANREKEHYLRTRQIQRAKNKTRKAQMKRWKRMAAMHAREGAVEVDGTDQRASASATGQRGIVTLAGERGGASEVEAGKNGTPSDETKSTAGTQVSRSTRADDGAPVSPVTPGVKEQPSHEHGDPFSEPDSESEPSSLPQLSDRELEIQVDAQIEQFRRMAVGPPAVNECPDEFELDPWNAVAVVGLRVYHRTGEGGDDDVVQLRVVRPNPYACWDDETYTDPGDGKRTELDVDDSARDATMVGRRQIIVGND